MLRVTVLGSGSRGNAILIDGTESALLIDAGFSPRALARRLAAAGRRPEQISSLLLTHEHTDHACGAAAACAKWGWPLRSAAGTLAALETETGTLRTSVLQADAPTVFDGWSVETVRVPHDARDCAALVLTDMTSGERVGVALDLGHVPETLPTAFQRLDLLVVESNHDERMLAHGPYPWMLKQRIGGSLGHLSNGATATFVAACAHKSLRGVMLAHLSETNNTPDHAVARSRDALRRAGWRREAVWAAAQGTHTGPIGLDGVTVAHAPLQLALGL
jgi:phosphoribosyl 1,2-cyclic phosphodiesterase